MKKILACVAIALLVTPGSTTPAIAVPFVEPGDKEIEPKPPGNRMTNGDRNRRNAKGGGAGQNSNKNNRQTPAARPARPATKR